MPLPDHPEPCNAGSVAWHTSDGGDVSLADTIAMFLRKRSLPSPDGRALYAYLCSDEEFALLGQELTEALGRGPRRHDPAPSVAQAFCLWGAEWWRRNHESGPWAWEEMLASIESADHAPSGPYYGRLQQLVAQGIRLWNRELLRFATGRAFLVTLGCEGGLPLKLVRRETAALRHFFKDLLEEIRIFGPLGVPARDLAERTAFRLPRMLRQEVVYELSGDLASAIWRLQREVGESSNPVQALNELRPDWRNDLPIAVDDDVARTLLNNLLLDAADLARGRGGRIRWARSLSAKDGGYRLVGRLVLPGTLQSGDVQGLWPVVSIPPRRFEIGVESGESLEIAAFATRRGGQDAAGGEHYVLENVLEDDSAVNGPAAAKGRRLVLRTATGTVFSTDSFAGAMSLSDLPWVFEDTGESNEELRLVGEGSTSVRADAAVVALDAETTVEPDGDTKIEEAGRLESFDRRLVRIRGTARFRDADGNLIVVRTRAERDSESVEYRLQGPLLALSRDGATVFLGPPTVFSYSPDGLTERVRTSALEWKSDLKGSQWEPLSPGCVGSGRVRYVRETTTVFSHRINVVPAETEVHFVPNRDGRSGTIEFMGIGSVETAVLEPQGIGVDDERVGSDLRRLTLSAQGRVPTDVDLLLRWPDRGEIRLSLPFPAQRAWFETVSGRPLPNDAAISVDRLARIRAVAVVPGAQATFNVEGGYRGADANRIESRNRLLRQEMRAIAPGLFEADLALLHRTIESRLAFSNDETGHVRLMVRSDEVGGLDLPSLRVYRYDFQLWLDSERSEVAIPEDALVKLTEEEILALRAEAISLIAPQDPPVALKRLSNTRWHFPEDELDPGPWLVLAWHGDWCRARPLWRYIRPANGTDVSGHALLEVFRSRGTDEIGRRAAASALVHRLRTNAGDPAWTTVDAQLEWTAHLPAVTFDLLTALANDPGAAAFAALRAPNDVTFSRLWRALETLPFWWRAISAQTWEESMEAYIDSLVESFDPLRETLGDETVDQLIEEQVDAAVARIEAELGSAAPALVRAAARCLGRRPDERVSALYKPEIRAHLMRERHQLKQDAHDQLNQVPWSVHLDTVGELAIALLDLHWSRDFFFQANRSMEERRFKLLNAPVVAALCAATGFELPPRAVYQLRSLADLVPAWFADIYDRTFWCALGIIAEERRRRILVAD